MTFDRVVRGYIGLCFIAVVLFWVLAAYLIYQLTYVTPEGAGRVIGEFMRGIDNGRDGK